MRKSLSAIIFFTFFSCTVRSSAPVIDIPQVADFEWRVDDSGDAVITGYTGAGGAVTIPHEINWAPVISIKDGAFSDKRLTSVTIPSSVTSIGFGAFQKNQLAGIDIPASVTSIRGSAFGENFNLRAINIHPDNKNYSSIDGVMYDKTGTTLLQWPAGKGTVVTIPNSVTAIGDWAFYGINLTALIIPDSVTTIGAHSFALNQLSELSIPASVTSIGTDAFFRNKLKSLVIPPSITSIGHGVFCSNELSSVVIPNTVTSIGIGAFRRNQLSAIAIPNSVTIIESQAFFYNLLSSLTIPSSVTAIDTEAFSNNRLTSITIGANVQLYIGRHGDTVFEDTGNFDETYRSGGMLAGTYIRSNVDSSEWIRR
ncbi:MAG: leucine-rich repeat domain-containing protein [Treponema sp.]|jgi:hypothetical protein|nr:leucine-rich repeat domain-containing protein [Treponema sp.]